MPVTSGFYWIGLTLRSYARRHDIRRRAPLARRASQFDRILVAVLRFSWHATRYGREVDFETETQLTLRVGHLRLRNITGSGGRGHEYPDEAKSYGH